MSDFVCQKQQSEFREINPMLSSQIIVIVKIIYFGDIAKIMEWDQYIYCLPFAFLHCLFIHDFS
jgi:hypothetical protein